MIFDVLFEIGEVFDAYLIRCASPAVNARRPGVEQELVRLADQQPALDHAVYEMASLKGDWFPCSGKPASVFDGRETPSAGIAPYHRGLALQ